jgi:hypothetical protein
VKLHGGFLCHPPSQSTAPRARMASLLCKENLLILKWSIWKTQTTSSCLDELYWVAAANFTSRANKPFQSLLDRKCTNCHKAIPGMQMQYYYGLGWKWHCNSAVLYSLEYKEDSSTTVQGFQSNIWHVVFPVWTGLQV